jgi:hypothetical protein
MASGVVNASAGAAGGDPTAVAHARMLRDHALQFDFRGLPPPRQPPPTHAPEWLKAIGRLFDAMAPAFGYIFYVGAGLVLAVIVFFIVRELIRLRWPPKKAKRVKPTPDWRPTAAQALALLEDADKLAAEGRFAEAVHLILFRSIEEIQGRRPHLVKPALTSRDIAGLEGLPAQARAAFAGIAAMVERSFFGGRAVDAAGFRECRDAYEAFAFPEAWR